MQHDVVNYATQLLSLKAQIICKHFTDETIVKISGAMQMSDADKQLIPQALELLKDEATKNFRIEVSSDSMVFQDEEAEKQNRMAFLGAVSSFINQSLPVAQSAPELTPLLMEMLKFGVTAFKAGKQMEGLIDETADRFREQAKKMEGQPKPPPIEIQKAQMDAQSKQAEIKAHADFEMQKLQAEMQAETHKQEMQAQENQLRNQLEHERAMSESQAQMELEKLKLDAQTNKDLLVTYLNNAAKIETTRISAGLDTGEMAYADNVQQASILQDSLGYSDMKNHPLQPAIENMQMTNQQMTQMLAMLLDKLNKPKTVIRDENGKIVGVH
jgi:hypothetical protein